MCVFLITGSPVSVLSLMLSDTESTRLPSAGTSSPVSRITTSPTTMSRRATCVMFPSRTTVTAASSFIWLSISNFLLAFSSMTNPITVASVTARKMPSGSRNAFPPALSQKAS